MEAMALLTTADTSKLMISHFLCFFPKQSSAVGVLTVLYKGPCSVRRHVHAVCEQFRLDISINLRRTFTNLS